MVMTMIRESEVLSDRKELWTGRYHLAARKAQVGVRRGPCPYLPTT